MARRIRPLDPLVGSDGARAVQICAERGAPIDIVLMDVIMPGESGPAVGERIRRMRPEARIIYTSGYTGELSDHHRAAWPGDAFLQKPFNATQLVRAIRDVLLTPSSHS